MGKTDSIYSPVAGKVGPLVFYSLRGTDKMIVRARPRVTKTVRKHAACYENTRLQNNEFKGCVKMAKEILHAVGAVACLRDFNCFGHLVKLCKHIQQEDDVSPVGKRSVKVSRFPSYLHGFSFNKYHTFESMARSPMAISIDRVAGKASLMIPAMQPGIQLLNHSGQPFFRILFCLGIICDQQISAQGYQYESPGNDPLVSIRLESAWVRWPEPFPATEMILEIPDWIDLPHRTLVSSIGIEFGQEIHGAHIKPVKYSGAGKVWSTA